MDKIKFVMTNTSEIVTEVCREALEAKGVTVMVCDKNGTAALETLLAVHPQACLLDAFMPDLDIEGVHYKLPAEEVLALLIGYDEHD